MSVWLNCSHQKARAFSAASAAPSWELLVPRVAVRSPTDCTNRDATVCVRVLTFTEVRSVQNPVACLIPMRSNYRLCCAGCTDERVNVLKLLNQYPQASRSLLLTGQPGP